MNVKKFLMLTGDFVEDYEVMVPFQALAMLGHTVHVVCPDRKAGDRIKTAIHDFEGDQTYTEKLGHFFTLNATFAEVLPEDYDALLLPGGRAPEYLRLNERVLEIVRYFAYNQKPIGAICHGIQILTAANVVKGRTCTTYCGVGPEVKQAGARYIEMPVDQAHADGNLVTAPAWPANAEWLKKVLKVMDK